MKEDEIKIIRGDDCTITIKELGDDCNPAPRMLIVDTAGNWCQISHGVRLLYDNLREYYGDPS